MGSSQFGEPLPAAAPSASASRRFACTFRRSLTFTRPRLTPARAVALGHRRGLTGRGSGALQACPTYVEYAAEVARTPHPRAFPSEFWADARQRYVGSQQVHVLMYWSPVASVRRLRPARRVLPEQLKTQVIIMLSVILRVCKRIGEQSR